MRETDGPALDKEEIYGFVREDGNEMFRRTCDDCGADRKCLAECCIGDSYEDRCAAWMSRHGRVDQTAGGQADGITTVGRPR